jgi:hypothetical protein
MEAQRDESHLRLQRDEFRLRFNGDRAYRGYLIRDNRLRTETWVEKGGILICYAETNADAVSKIDALIDEEE